MADIVLKDKNGNLAPFEGVKQLKVPNSEGGKTLYTNLENMEYYGAIAGAGEGQYKIVGRWFWVTGTNFLMGVGGKDDEGNNFCAIFTTENLTKGKTYGFRAGGSVYEILE